MRNHDVAPKISRSIGSRRTTGHASWSESLARISHCVPDTHKPLDQLLVTGLVPSLLSSHLPQPVVDLLSALVASPSLWGTPWYLNYYFRGSGGLYRRLDRLSSASNVYGERRSTSISHASISGTRSRGCVLLVPRETPELALWCYHGDAYSHHQSSVCQTRAAVLTR